MLLTWHDVLAGLGMVLGPFLLLFLGCGREVRLAGWAVFTGLLGSFLVSSYAQLSHRYPPPSYRSHVVNHGGQVGMWGNYHVEVTRNPGEEYRVWLSDAYRRPIAARYFSGQVTPLPAGTGVELTESLSGSYAFARMPRGTTAVRLSLAVPQGSMQFGFNFIPGAPRSYPPGWCGPTPPLQSASSPGPRG